MTDVSKAEATRRKIIDSAMELFTENGYEQTTMRLVAARAGVSVGNAYYYFDSKEALMQGFYDGLLQQFSKRVDKVLAEESAFDVRLCKVLLEWIDNARTFHTFADSFFRYAANPHSPLSPFSEESRETREAAIAIFERVIEGSNGLKMSKDLRPRLPQLLWLFQMGMVLYWVYDESPKQKQSVALVKHTVPLVTRLIGLSRLPVLRTTASDMLRAIDTLTPTQRARRHSTRARVTNAKPKK